MVIRTGTSALRHCYNQLVVIACVDWLRRSEWMLCFIENQKNYCTANLTAVKYYATKCRWNAGLVKGGGTTTTLLSLLLTQMSMLLRQALNCRCSNSTKHGLIDGQDLRAAITWGFDLCYQVFFKLKNFKITSACGRHTDTGIICLV